MTSLFVAEMLENLQLTSQRNPQLFVSPQFQKEFRIGPSLELNTFLQNFNAMIANTESDHL